MNELNDLQQPMEEVHLYDYLRIVLRRKKTVLLVFLAIFLGVAVYTLTAKPVYEASATINVQNAKKKGDLLTELTGNTGNSIDTEIEILRSRTNAEEVVKRLHLNWRFEDVPKTVTFKPLEFSSDQPDPVFSVEMTGPDTYLIRSGDGRVLARGKSGERLTGKGVTLLLQGLHGRKGDAFTLRLASPTRVADALKNQVRASELGKGTNIIEISYQGTNPGLTRDVVNTLAQVYLERTVTVKSEEARRTVDFIERQLNEVKGQLNKAEENLAVYKQKSGAVQLDAEGQALVQNLADLEKQHSTLALGQSQLLFAVDSLKDAMKRGESYSPSVMLDDPVVAALAQSLADLEVKKQGLLVEYTESHPAVQDIDSRILEVQRKLLATYLAARKDLDVRTKSLDGDVADYEKRLKKLPRAEQQLARLTRLTTVTADSYTFLLQKHEEARIAKASTISNINVIDPAITPRIPIKPNKKKNLLLGLIVGLMAGVGLAFFLDYLDDTIKDAEQAKRVLGWGVLSVIPFIGERKEGNGESDKQRVLISHLEPRSGAAEAFRSLRTALHFAAGGDREKKIHLVTSAFPGEGKTTVAANLAETMAQTGARVLLVGCDLRRPTLHTIFDFPRSPGLTEVLVGDAGLEESIHSTGINALDYIGSGAIPPNPAELLGSDKMRELLDDLRERYDTILLDAAPLLAVTDTALLTRVADQVAVVMEAGAVPLKAAQRLQEMLRSAQAPVAGLILNDKSGKVAESYRYYGKYGYRYQYGYGYGVQGEEKSRGGVLGRFFRRS